MSEVLTMTSAELVADLAINGPGARCKISESLYEDAVYALPTHYSLTKTILPAFEQWQHDQGIWRDWRTKYDCDDYAIAFQYFSQRCFANTADETDAEGYAVMRCSYKINGDKHGGHKINLVKSDRGFDFIEPQTAMIVELTRVERDSVWFINR
jgi:hypothetical protein